MRTAQTTELATRKPFDGLFPWSQAVADAIRSDMEARGYDDAFPIVLWDNTIVDGHTRAKVARELGLAVQVVEKNFGSVREALDYAVHCQKDRRNMTNAGIMAAVRAIDEEERTKARGRQGSRTDMRTSGTSTSEDAKVGGRNKSATRVAKTLGIGEATVGRVRAIDRGPEEIRTRVEAGEMSISAGANAARSSQRTTNQAEIPRFVHRIKRALDEGDLLVRNEGMCPEGIKMIEGFVLRIQSIALQARAHQ